MAGRTVGARVTPRHRCEVARSDRRWLLAWSGAFLVFLVLIFSAYGIYKLTGPHPQMTLFLRQLRHHARWIIPGMKSPRDRKHSLRVEPDELRYAAVDLPRR